MFGRGHDAIFTSSSPILSFETFALRADTTSGLPMALYSSVSIQNPSLAANLAALSTLRGSSMNIFSGAIGERRTFSRRSSIPPQKSSTGPFGTLQNRAFTVKSLRMA